MNPDEIAEKFDATRDALALVDTALNGDGAAAWYLAGHWATCGEVLLEQMLGLATILTIRIGQLTGLDPHRVVQNIRDDVALAEAHQPDERN